MYTGTVIDELTAVVERAETRADEREREDRLAYWLPSHNRNWRRPIPVLPGWHKWQRRRAQQRSSGGSLAGRELQKFTLPRRSTILVWSRSKTPTAAAR